MASVPDLEERTRKDQTSLSRRVLFQVAIEGQRCEKKSKNQSSNDFHVTAQHKNVRKFCSSVGGRRGQII
eukprot:105674-Rhodomonas_salina.1